MVSGPSASCPDCVIRRRIDVCVSPFISLTRVQTQASCLHTFPLLVPFPRRVGTMMLLLSRATCVHVRCLGSVSKFPLSCCSWPVDCLFLLDGIRFVDSPGLALAARSVSACLNSLRVLQVLCWMVGSCCFCVRLLPVLQNDPEHDLRQSHPRVFAVCTLLLSSVSW